MGNICFANSADDLAKIVKREYGDLTAASFEERIKAIEKLNPRLPTKGPVQTNQAILLPSDGPVRMPTSEDLKITEHLNSIPCDSKSVLAELCDEEQFETLAAIADVFEAYDLWAISGDLNTYGSAGIGNAVTRSSQLHKAIAQIDEALVELVNTPKGQRHPIKLKIKGLYRDLHAQFGVEIRKMLARNYKGRRGHPLMSSKRGMNMTLGRSRRMPLTSLNSVKNMTKFATAGKIVGRGLVVLDLGIRGQSVYSTYSTGGNWQREAFAQFVGLGLSVYFGGLAFSFLLGPAGVIVALIIAGVAAIGMDYAGRYVGYKVFDTGRDLQRYIQPPYVY